MTSAVMFVGPAETSEHCMVLMTENRLRHLPVVEDGKLLGLISIGDLVKDIISEQKFVIEQLEHYITGYRGWAGEVSRGRISGRFLHMRLARVQKVHHRLAVALVGRAFGQRHPVAWPWQVHRQHLANRG